LFAATRLLNDCPNQTRSVWSESMPERNSRVHDDEPETSSRTGRRYSPPLSSISGVFQVTPSGLGIGVCVMFHCD
jgi:hypothetical protein